MERAEIQQAAQVVAKQLNETNKGAIRKIEMVIEHLGIDFVQSNVEETLLIEAEGGLMLNNNSRRRTTGGVFFHIAKSKLSPEQHAVLFPPPEWKEHKAKIKRKKQAKKRAEKDKSKQQKLSLP